MASCAGKGKLSRKRNGIDQRGGSADFLGIRWTMTGIGQQSAELSIGSQFSLEMSLAWEGILRWFLKMFRFIGRKRTFGLRTRT